MFTQIQGPSIPSNVKENGRVDDQEKEVFLNHIDGSTRNLEVFLGNTGLALNPDGLFEADLFDMNPEVEIDLMGVTGIDDAPMKIRIDVVLELTGEERILLISDFIRPQLGTGIWTMNGDPSVNRKKKIVKRIYKEYLRDMNDLIDRWYSLRLIQSLKDD